MATKSITHNVTIRDQRQCRALLRALERSRASKVKKAITKSVDFNPSKEKLAKLFAVEGNM